MSVIVALRVGDKIAVGCDGLASLDGRVISDDLDKIFYSKSMGLIVGAAGDLSETQRIFSGLESGVITVEKNASGGIDFIDNGESRGNATCLIAYKGVILTMDHAGAIIKRGDYAIIGDGSDIASGAVEMAIKHGLVSKSDPRRVVREATEIASKLSVFCGGKIRTYVV